MTDPECVLEVTLFGPEMEALKRISYEIREKYNIPAGQVVADEVYEEYGFKLDYKEDDTFSGPMLVFKSPEAKTYFILTQL